MMLLVTRAADFLTNLTCGCGKPATVGWHRPLETGTKQQKMSKTEKVVLPKKEKPDPYGWSCEDHVPPGVM